MSPCPVYSEFSAKIAPGKSNFLKEGKEDRMSDEVRLWRIGSDESLSEVQREPLDLEARLQNWLARDISILDPGLLVIGREVETDFGGSIDLLCMDAVGDLVVVELKRDKTRREITAQVLDYGSWVVDLSNKEVKSIAEEYLRKKGIEQTFEQAFKDHFRTDVPEMLNGEHRLLIVGSRIDDSTERIVKYLSEIYGVNINAATFQHFRTPDGAELLARVFFIEPSEVESHSRSKPTSKRLPNLTDEEIRRLAEEAGVQEIYGYAVAAFGRLLKKQTTRSSITFATALPNGPKRGVVLSFWPGPGDSSTANGLKYQLYKNRFAAVTGLTELEVEDRMPASREAWSYWPAGGPDLDGFEGYIKTTEEINRLADALKLQLPLETSEQSRHPGWTPSP